MSSTMGIEEAVRGFWSSRPDRPLQDRKVAGVCAAIARRYAIDPVLVRVMITVTALFGGSGLLFYLLGWLFLPQQGDEVSGFESMINRGRSSMSTGFAVLLCIALIPATSWTFGGGFLFGGSFSGIAGAAVLLVGLYLLHRTRTELGVVQSPPAQAQPEQPSPFARMFHAAAPTTSTSWDPLGAAPFAWELPDPQPVSAPVEPPPLPARPRRRPRAGLVGLLTAVVTFGGCLALSPVTGGWMTTGHIIGCVLASVALCMISFAFAGAGRGLIPLALVLSVGAIVSTNSGHWNWQELGSHVSTPTSLEQVQPNYSWTAGNYELDLTSLPGKGSVTTSVSQQLGRVLVLVPPTADVTVHCVSKAGGAVCLDRRRSGTGTDLRVVDNGTDGPGGLKITLDVSNKAGEVEVRRG